MANEIALTLNLAVGKNGANGSVLIQLTQDMTGNQFINNVQNIGTTNEAILLGDVGGGDGTIGWIAIKNLDATNYVEIFLDNANTQLVAKLLPGANGTGEGCLIKPGTAVYARANTAAVNVQVLGIEL